MLRSGVLMISLCMLTVSREVLSATGSSASILRSNVKGPNEKSTCKLALSFELFPGISTRVGNILSNDFSRD